MNPKEQQQLTASILMEAWIDDMLEEAFHMVLVVEHDDSLDMEVLACDHLKK